MLPALMLAASLCGSCRRPTARADVLVLTRSDGSKSELKGSDETVVLAFVSRRSPPSRALLEGLRQAAATVTGARFIAVLADRDVEPSDQNLTGFEVVQDPDKSVAARYQASVLPTVVVLDRRLEVVFREEGFSPLTAGRLAGALAAGRKQP